MQAMHISRLDLNLLVVFDAIHREGRNGIGGGVALLRVRTTIHFPVFEVLHEFA